ncbi:hypothetical protein [Desulfovibrio ferrophilus]|uniref:Uncharacterized protein n=1 Tax=Desulfovibrio ferrophilus TaxID=241368 RepID=A0A2Z6AZK6_9BACT|nr:hypothetical protein [Desulfovibrio ferrophilus]BBD08707.1 uncharacterized protein DFE_1981 [Desulfovibrio ferrophilus]
MHPGRRNILIRWIGYVLVIVVTAGWIYMDEPQRPRVKSDILKRLAPKTLNVPSNEVTDAIQAAILVSKKKVATFGSVEKIDPTLIVLDAASLDAKRDSLNVTTIFLGPPDKFAVLGGKIYKLGDVLPDGRMVKGIDAEGVNLALGDTVDRMPWIHPFRVELTGGPKSREREQSADGEGEDGTTGEQGSQDVNLQNLPSDLSPDQALDILQQIGKQ